MAESQGSLLDQDGQTTPTTPSAAPSAPAQDAAPPSSDSGLSTSQASPQPSQAPSQPSFIEQLRGIGVHANDEAHALQVLQQTIKQAQEAQQYAQYGQYYLQHADQFQRWQNEQRSQTPAQKESPWWSEWWNPPEYDPSWSGLVSTDPETGRPVLAPGAPPDILPKHLAYQQYRRNATEQFLSNPYKFIEAPVKKLAEQIAQEQVQKHLSQYQERIQANDFASRNSSWLYQTDPNGQVLVDPIRRSPMLSPWGERFRDYVVQAEQMGLPLQGQESYAMTAIQRDMAVAQYQAVSGQQQPPGAQQMAQATPRQQANQAFLQQAAGKPPAKVGNVPVAPSGGIAAADDRNGLAKMLRKAMSEHGITDQALRSA